MPLTYFKCADTLLAYCNKSIPEEPSLWYVKLSLSKLEVFGKFGVECVIFQDFYISVFRWFLID